MEIEDFEKYNLGIALRKSENSEIEDFGLAGKTENFRWAVLRHSGCGLRQF